MAVLCSDKSGGRKCWRGFLEEHLAQLFRINPIGALATAQICNSLSQSQSWTNLEDGQRGKKTNIKLKLALELACRSSPKP